MKILGIETATVICGAAVVVHGKLIAQRHIRERNAHAENIMRLLDDVLGQASLQASDLDAVAVSIGPGSFTGLRIGLSVAKGLCYALDKPLVAVPTLEALARHAVDAGAVSTEFIVSALDARRNEVYCQMFRVHKNGVLADSVARDRALDALLEEIAGKDVMITGDAIPKLKAEKSFDGVRFVADDYAGCNAGAVALLACDMAERGEFAGVAETEPAYIKEFFTQLPH